MGRHLIGIDYSISSPGLCYYYDTNDDVKGIDIKKCEFMTLTEDKKLLSHKKFSNYKNFNWKIAEEWDNFCMRWSQHAHLCLDWIQEKRFTDKDSLVYVAIEGYAFGAKGQVFNIAEATGILKWYLHTTGYKFIIYQPPELKKWYTGNGKAKKDIIKDFVEEKNIIKVEDYFNIPFNVTKSPINDLLDAYVAVSMMYNQFSNNIITDKDFV